MYKTHSNWLARNNIYISGTRKLDGCEQEILACFSRDMPLVRVAEQFKVSPNTLRNWLKANDLYQRTMD